MTHYSYTNTPYTYEVSLELDNDIILDIDTKGKAVAVEFLNASKLFKINKCYLKNILNIKIQSWISDEAISLKVKIHSENQIFNINKITSNLNNIPSLKIDLAMA